MKKITIFLLSAAALASGCKRFTDINQNPNQPTAVTTNVVLSAALTAAASSINDQTNLNEWMGYWSRSGSFIAVQSTEQYQTTSGYADGTFQDLYFTLSKFNYIENVALKSTSTLAFYAGVAKTMKAIYFSILVDDFGDVPYSQAFQINKYVTPQYDKAPAIYANLIKQLDSAVYYFGVANTYYAGAPGNVKTIDNQYDIVFGRGGGTSASARVTKWIEFANTVKLKLLMNEAKVSGVDISGEIAKAVANGGFLPAGTSAAVNPGYGNSKASQLNPFYSIFLSTAGSPSNTYNFFRANSYAVDFYHGHHEDGSTGTTDSYRPVLVYAPLSGSVIGSNYDGDLNSTSNSFTSGLGNGVLKSPGQDQLILSDFESLFLQAEATARGYNVGSSLTADQLNQKAVEQNFVYLTETAADADTYYTSGATDPDVSVVAAASPAAIAKLPANCDQTPGLQAIMTQKWIALNSINWFQAWTDYRRTGFPLANVLGISHANTHVKNAIPYRYLYPSSEISSNGANVPSLPNGQYTPIFWDVYDK